MGVGPVRVKFTDVRVQGMNGLWSKVRDFVGFHDPVDGLEEYPDFEAQQEYQSLYEGQHRRSTPLVSQPLSPVEEEEPADLTSSLGLRERSLGRAEEREQRRRRTAEVTETSGRDRRSSRERSLGSGMSSNVIGMPNVNQASSEVVVMEPRSFDEMAQVVQNLRERKTVILNLTLMDPVDAQRSVDFVAGGTYAIDGHQERIGENIFLFTPSCVSVTTPASPQPVQIPVHTPTQTATPVWSTAFAEPPHAVGQR